MGKLPTRISEKVYMTLVRYAAASGDYHEKEVFVFHFSIIEESSNSYRLTCSDGERRLFNYSKDRLWVEGKRCIRANSELMKINNSITKEFMFKEFIVYQNAV